MADAERSVHHELMQPQTGPRAGLYWQAFRAKRMSTGKEAYVSQSDCYELAKEKRSSLAQEQWTEWTAFYALAVMTDGGSTK